MKCDNDGGGGSRVKNDVNMMLHEEERGYGGEQGLRVKNNIAHGENWSGNNAATCARSGKRQRIAKKADADENTKRKERSSLLRGARLEEIGQRNLQLIRQVFERLVQIVISHLKTRNRSIDPPTKKDEPI